MMKFRSALLCAAILACTASFAADLPWAKSFADAKSKAAPTGKLIMIDFFTTWCVPCKQMKATTFKDAVVIKKAAALIPLGLDAEKEGKALAAKYKVTAYPTIIFIDSNGSVFRRLQGAYPPDAFRGVIDGVLKMYADYKIASAAIKKNPKDSKVIAKLAWIDAGRGELASGEKYAKQAEALGFKGTDLIEAWLLLGDGRRQAKNSAGAIQAYDKALRLSQTGSQKGYAYLAMAVVYYEAGDAGRARMNCQAAISTKGVDADTKTQAQRLMSMLR